MRIEFKYSLISDLVFHVLAFMQVDNDSNLYSKEYIDSFSSNQVLLDRVSKIEDYYNNNFDRLSMVNFLPIYCDDLDSLSTVLLSYDRFTSEDINNFIKPFIAILKDEYQQYTDYWRIKTQNLVTEKSNLEKYISDCLNDYKNIFDYYGKNAEVYFSISLTCNGRGIYSESGFSAIVPYTSTQKGQKDCFFQLFHEYTHQFTDKFLNVNISMTDGSHELSEKLVILADYFIFKRTDKEIVNAYLQWIEKNSGKEKYTINEIKFLNAFQIPTELMCALNNEITKIYRSH